MSACLAGLILVGANDALQTAAAQGDTRTLSFRHLHTKETITVTYKRNGRYDDAALKKLDWFMRDWRRDESVKMNPQLFDLLWETYREVGGQRPIEVICGYRAPGTNAMLRARSSGVAQNSNHVTGEAIDFVIPDVPLEKVREIGLRLQRGGVGFYPTSGSPFVHLDTGTVRHWPRMTHEQLAKVFPDGRTVHIPSDGQPLSGYALALADIEARGNEPSNVSLAAARDAGIVTAGIAQNSGSKGKRSFLASLFGGGQGEDEAEDQPTAKPAPVASASLSASTKPKPVAVARIVPLPSARPKTVMVAQAAIPADGNAANTIFNNRGLWIGAVESGELPAPVSQSPFALAGADPLATGSTAPAALGYATETPLPKPARARPMGAKIPTLAAEASVMPDAPAAAIAPVKSASRAFAPELTSGAQRADSPWLRAAMLTPSVSGFLTATPLGAPHMRPLATLLLKPDQSLLMTFSADPHLGVVADRFSGRAVEFLATATFTVQTTASLR